MVGKISANLNLNRISKAVLNEVVSPGKPSSFRSRKTYQVKDTDNKISGAANKDVSKVVRNLDNQLKLAKKKSSAFLGRDIDIVDSNEVNRLIQSTKVTINKPYNLKPQRAPTNKQQQNLQNLKKQQNLIGKTRIATPEEFKALVGTINNAKSLQELTNIEQKLNQQSQIKYPDSKKNILQQQIATKKGQLASQTSKTGTSKNKTNNLATLKDQIKNASSVEHLDAIKANLRQGKFGKYSHKEMGQLELDITDKRVVISDSNAKTKTTATPKKPSSKPAQASVGKKYDFNQLRKMNYQQLSRAAPKLSKQSRTRLYNDLGNGVYKQLEKTEVTKLRGFLNQLYF